jgi:ferredoxin
MIRIVGKDKTVDTRPLVSILNNLLMNGAEITHVCGGKAQCGTCVIRVKSGAEYLSPRTEKENNRLSAVFPAGVPVDVRLACQTYTRGDIEIEIGGGT